MELYINDELVDMKGDEVVALTLATNDFQNIASRNGGNTNNFQLPPTHKNNRIFKAHQDQAVRIEQDGVPQMRGFARYYGRKEDLDLICYAGNTDWFELVKGKKLSELNLTDLNHEFNASNVEANRLNDYTKGFVYPNILYGFATNTPWETYDFFPALYYHRILKQILADVGYETNGDLFDDPLFRKCILPFAGEKLMSTVYPIDIITSTLVDQILTVSGSDDTVGPVYLMIGPGIVDPFAGIDTLMTSNTLADASSIKVICSTIYSVSFNFNFNLNVTQVDLSFNLIEKQSGSIISTYNASRSGALGYKEVQGSFTDVNLDAGKEYSISLTVAFTGTGDINSTFFQLTTVAESGFHVKGNLMTGQPLRMIDILPDMLQKDFVKLVFMQFGVIQETDIYEKSVKFTKFKTVGKNRVNAQDWTSKADLTEPVDEKYDLPGYGQYNYFKYKIDENDSITSESLFTVENTLLKKEYTVYESPFAAISRGFYGIIQLARMVFRNNYDLIKLAPKCAYVELTNSNIITQHGQATPLNSAEVFFTDLRWQSLMPTYMQDMITAIQNQTILNVQMRFKTIDICNMDFTRPVWIDFMAHGRHFQGYYFINLISQYKIGLNESCRVELIPIDDIR